MASICVLGRRDAGIDANAPDPGKVARGPHPSVSVRKKMDPAAPEPDSAVETVRAAAMTSPDAARTARVRTRNESAESREASAGQQVERESRPNGMSVVPEPDSAGQARPGGNFFREPGQSGQPGKEIPNPVEGTRINVSPRSLEGGEHLTVKNPDVEGIFMPQTPAASRPEPASATAMKARGAEVLRQVEAGAFRDLGQGNKIIGAATEVPPKSSVYLSFTAMIVISGAVVPTDIESISVLKDATSAAIMLVNPERFLDPVATARAAGADDVLQAAPICQSLDEALHGTILAIALSARQT